MKYDYFIEPWYDDKERDAIAEYMQSGGWLTEYQKTRDLENMISSYLGVKHCFLVPSCTTALSIAAMALNLQGAEVLVPDYSMIASANSMVLAGAKPVLTDVEEKTFCIDVYDMVMVFESTPHTKAVVLVSINGRYPHHIDELFDFCYDEHIRIIEDAAQSLGSKHDGAYMGTKGDIGCYSFSMYKTITTGQGGALVTNDDALAEKIQGLKNFGRICDNSDLHGSIGYNFHFTDVQAVIGIEQMKKLNSRLQRKKEMVALYQELIGDVVSFPETKEGNCLWLIDVLSTKRDALQEYLKEKGIGTRKAYPGIHTQSPYRTHRWFPCSEFLAKNTLYLPSGCYLSDEDIQHVCEVVRSHR